MFNPLVNSVALAQRDKRALADGILSDGDAAALPSTEDLVALIRGE